MRRGLTHYWRMHLAVAIAVAVCGAVLCGALLVGDSVRGSLRDLTLDRLGGVDVVLVAERFFRAELANDLQATPGFERFDRSAGAILLRGNAVHGASRARASQINVLGVGPGFVDMVTDAETSAAFRAAETLDPATFEFARGGAFPPIIINEALADELGAAIDDQVLIRFQLGAEIPRDTLLGSRETDEVVGTIRGRIQAVVPNQGIGRFDLTPHQSFPLNAYLDLERLQAALEQADRINAVLLSGSQEIADEAQEELGSALQASDFGLRVVTRGDRPFVEVSSDEFVVRPALAEAVARAAGELGATTLPLQAYLANSMEIGDRAIPYSMVLALDPPTDSALDVFRLVDGSPAPGLGDDEILLNRWSADDLGAAVGDRLQMDYYVVGIDERLRTERAEFVVAGIVAMEGLAGDPRVTPEYPGIEGVENIADWDPPFPVDLAAIRPVDEAYWDDHRGTPKAFVSRHTGERLWSTRYGSTTAIRVGVPGGSDPAELANDLAQAVRMATAPAQVGYRFIEAKRLGLTGSRGATDFAGLFIGFSFFIIFSALLIVAMLFSLGADSRAREIGTLLALGFPLRTVRRRFLAEGAVVAVVGGVFGALAGIGYARLMLLGLTTIWLPAVGSPLLFLHVVPRTLAAGFALTVTVVLLSIFVALRRLRRLPATRLLAGVARETGTTSGGSRLGRFAPAGIGVGLALVGMAAVTGQTANPGLAFASGFALLIGGLGTFARWNRTNRGTLRTSRGAGVQMALRSSGWNPGRSLMSVTLVASASFVIATVASNTRDPGSDARVIEEGAGGYRLIAQTDVPLYQDLGNPDGLFDLGFSEDGSSLVAGRSIVQMRTVPGDDTSCLNLYQPQRPRLLGVPRELIAAGGFRFGASLGNDDAPWELLDTDFGDDVVPVIGDANSTQWILKLGIGEELVIADERGESIRLRLVGTLRESVFQSELLISEERLLRHFPSRSGFSFFMIEAGANEADAVTAELEGTLDRFGFDVTPSAQRIAAFLVVQNTYLSTFQALGGLGLLLGTLGLGIVLVRNVIERRGELATLRAIGFARRSLTRMVLAENALLLAIGILIGAGAGVVAVAPRLIAGELQPPWTALGIAMLTVIAVGMAASLGAVSLAGRIPLLPALKAER